MSILFTSDKNYMKRDSSSGKVDMLGPNTSEYFGAFYTRDYVVNHDLGYTPLFRIFYEPFGDGKIMTALQDSQYYLSNPVNTYGGGASGPTCMGQADDTNLTITLYYNSNSLAASSFPVYWVIYKDYGMEA
jgi:hypothetical protein